MEPLHHFSKSHASCTETHSVTAFLPLCDVLFLVLQGRPVSPALARNRRVSCEPAPCIVLPLSPCVLLAVTDFGLGAGSPPGPVAGPSLLPGLLHCQARARLATKMMLENQVIVPSTLLFFFLSGCLLNLGTVKQGRA